MPLERSNFKHLNLPFIEEKNIKFPIMNNIQKILLMVFFMSVTVFIITGYIFYSYQGQFEFEPSIWKYHKDYVDINTNWLGIIAFGNSIASLAGFFLFKDKK